MDLSRRGDPPHRGAGDGAGPRGARREGARALRSRPPPYGRVCTVGRGRRCARCPSGWCPSAARSGGRPTARSRTSPGIRRQSPPCAGSCARVPSTWSTSTSRWPVVGWDALTSADAPLVGTFHCYSESVLPHKRRRAPRRPPQAQPSEPADRGLRGRGVDRPALLRRPLPGDPQRRRAARGRGSRAALARAGEPLRIVFVGQAVERKGLPVLLRAFEALREQIPARADRHRPDATTSWRRCWSRRGRAARSAASTTRPRSARCATPTCCARRRWAASRSGWC